MKMHRRSVDTNPSGAKGATAKPALAKLSIGLRIAAVAVAVLASVLCVGLQVVLVATYSGEGEALIAKLRPAVTAGQVVASATHPASEQVAVQPEARTVESASAEERLPVNKLPGQ